MDTGPAIVPSWNLDDPPISVASLHALTYCERLFYLEEVEQHPRPPTPPSLRAAACTSNSRRTTPRRRGRR